MKKYSLIGVNGNAFAVMGYVCNAFDESGRALKRPHVITKANKDNYISLAMSGNYNELLVDHAKDRKIAAEHAEFQDDFLNDAIDFINAKSADEIADIQRQTLASLEEATFVYQDCAIHNAWSTEELKDLGIFQ